MNLETLVERACLESGYNDTDDVAAGKKFARHWDEHIWNAALWKAALVACDVSIDPTTNEDHVEGIVFLPEVVDRVVAVRCANNQLAVRGQEHHYQMDYDAFAATGQPVEFHILPPAWFTWRRAESDLYLKVTGEVADNAIELRILALDGSGSRRNYTAVINGTNQIAPASGDVLTVLKAAKPETTDVVEIGTPAATNLVAGNYFTFGGYTYRNVAVEVGKTYTYTPGNENTLQYTLNGAAIPAGNFTATSTAVLLMTDVGNAGLPATATIVRAELGQTVATLAAEDTISPLYQRIRLLPIPTAAFTLKVLGKAKYEPLDFDQQEPALRNCTNALLAFIRGSLKRRGGEIGAAQLEFQEGNALLQQVMQIEALQAANNQRFMPAEGYGPEHGLGPIGIV